jgi:transposase-like protein
VNNRQSASYWEERLRAEGLAPIEFTARGFVESSAEHHKEMTSNDRPHWVDAEQLARLRTIITEYRLPVQHRIVLTAIVDGHPVRAAARFAAINKDKAHRIVLRHLRVERVTNSELHDLPLHLSTDPRRISGRKRGSEERSRRDGARYDIPPSPSESTALYFEQAKAFIEHAAFKWALDREIWARHADGKDRRDIGRELGMPHDTVFRAIQRVRKQFKQWFRQRNEALKQQREDE